MPVRSARLGLAVAATILLLLGCPLTGAAQKMPGKPASPTAAGASPKVLPRMLAEGAEVLQKEAEALKIRAAAANKAWSQAQAEAQARKAEIAALKASMAVKSLPLIDAQEALKTYSHQEKRLGARRKELVKETEVLQKEQAARGVAQATLQEEVSRLQATRHPVARSREIKQSYQRYQQAAAAARQVMEQLLGSLGKESRLLAQEKELAAGVRAELHVYVVALWKAELLQRQKSLSLREQAVRIWQTLRDLPARISGHLGELWSSGALGDFFHRHPGPIIGLLALLILLVWGIHRLKGPAAALLAAWQAQARTLGLQMVLSLGQVIRVHLLLLAGVFWVWLSWFSLGLWEITPGRIFLYLLAALMVLRLGRHWLRLAFAGQEAGGLLPLDAVTARYYRRYLQLLLLYLVLGVWGLASAGFLGFPPSSRQLMGHLFRVGLLGWAMWLLRRKYLESLLPELPVPRWLKKPGVVHVIKGLVLLLLAVIILANLLKFQNLADYLSEAGAVTGVALLFLGLLWLGLDGALHYLLHPEKGWARRRYPHRAEMLQKIHGMTRGGITALLAAAALLLALKAWGVNPADVAWAFRWLNWGPTLGSLKLTPLSLIGAVLALYLGVWISRLIRSFLDIRVYPHTGWDDGIQYTISTTLHYAVLLVGGLIALSVLGFPLTNLALIAGALGVGIGFGLQNIVSNFISGLILLFERPIKVGDMLVIDGQWGTVQEIRVRSTVFETFDRYVLIIPNSELLSGKILNWTYHGWGSNRLELKVGVGYGSDVRQVTGLLTDICLANPRVLNDPAPQVFFKAYGDSSLDFTIWVFLQHPKDRIPATHELNSAIFETFRQEGIEIPFPQRDLHIKNWPGSWGER
jgi:potassium efflux system protein